MKWYYLMLELASLSVPLVLSFTPKFGLKKNYWGVLLSIAAVAIPFILWDVYFTKQGIWGFNSRYHLNIPLSHLPLEEVLFFFCIPFACMFTYYNVQRFEFGSKISVNAIALLLVGFASTLLAIGWGGWYTMTAAIPALLLIALNTLFPMKNAPYFYTAYLILLVPFILVNGALTGMFTPEPVVWYNNLENSGLRFVSIPAEDFLYFFVMFGLTQRLYEGYKKSRFKAAFK